MNVLHPPLVLITLGLSASLGQAAASGDDFVQTYQLSGSTTNIDDEFGTAVAIDGPVTIIGSPYADEPGLASGSAWLFDSATGAELHKLLPTDGASNDLFGMAVDIDGNLAVVAAERDDDNGNDSGSAYVFDVSTGTQVSKLLPNDGAAGDGFGRSVAIDGNTVVVGALWDDDNGSESGSAYLFDATPGAQIAKLLPNDGAMDDFFGLDVAISGNRVLVGSPRDDDQGTFSGSAYLFDATTGAQVAKLLQANGESFDGFGGCVAIRGTTAIIGASGDDDLVPGGGALYLFDAVSFSQVDKLHGSDTSFGDRFGLSVDFDDDLIVAGSSKNSSMNPTGGSAYIFDRATGLELQQIEPIVNASGDRFGDTVGVSGGVVVAGAARASAVGVGHNSGSAYLFAVTEVGSNYCTANQTSLGVPATISASGSPSLAVDQFCLSTSPVPNQAFLYFYAPNQIQVPLGNGNLCAGGGIVRLGPPAVAQGNTATRSVDLSTEIAGTGTVHFQCWFRDTDGGGSLFNLSDGRSVTFVP